MYNVLNNNISDKYKFEWIAPERTGSRKISEILSYYGFKNNGTVLFNCGAHNYTHVTRFNEKYSDYKVICNARNPYGRVYSIFKNYHGMGKNPNSREEFKKFVKFQLHLENAPIMIVEPKWDKPFDYVIRLEHMKEDLMKLPFILDILTESQIEMIISHGKEIDKWEDFYDDELKEIVYNHVEHHFKLWGYEK
jgi:hypothetical protein